MSTLPLCFLNKYYAKEHINIASSSLDWSITTTAG